MSSNVNAFSPQTPFTISVSAVSASAAIPGSPARPTVRLFNPLSVIVFFAHGDSTVTATLTGIAMPPGGTEVFDFGFSTHLAAITAATSGTLYCCTGAKGI